MSKCENTVLTVSVTQTDISRGEQCNTQECAIARAIKRHLKRKYKKDISVSSIIKLSSSSWWNYYSWQATKKIKRFIDRFDANKKLVKPTDFMVKLPKKVVKGY